VFRVICRINIGYLPTQH